MPSMGKLPDRWRGGQSGRSFGGRKSGLVRRRSSPPPRRSSPKDRSGSPNQILLTRWVPYSPVGKRIPGTRFIAFKVPLKQSLVKTLRIGERFTPEVLMSTCPTLGIIIDLTNTTRYYNKDDFMRKGIEYSKVTCPGQAIPTHDKVAEFFKVVDDYLERHARDDSLIGVHCTHGVNRSGYFISRYMLQRMAYPIDTTLESVERARGYRIERPNYVDHLRTCTEVVPKFWSGPKGEKLQPEGMLKVKRRSSSRSRSGSRRKSSGIGKKRGPGRGGYTPPPTGEKGKKYLVEKGKSTRRSPDREEYSGSPEVYRGFAQGYPVEEYPGRRSPPPREQWGPPPPFRQDLGPPGVEYGGYREDQSRPEYYTRGYPPRQESGRPGGVTDEYVWAQAPHDTYHRYDNNHVGGGYQRGPPPVLPFQEGYRTGGYEGPRPETVPHEYLGRRNQYEDDLLKRGGPPPERREHDSGPYRGRRSGSLDRESGGFGRRRISPEQRRGTPPRRHGTPQHRRSSPRQRTPPPRPRQISPPPHRRGSPPRTWTSNKEGPWGDQPFGRMPPKEDRHYEDARRPREDLPPEPQGKYYNRSYSSRPDSPPPSYKKERFPQDVHKSYPERREEPYPPRPYDGPRRPTDARPRPHTAGPPPFNKEGSLPFEPMEMDVPRMDKRTIVPPFRGSSPVLKKKFKKDDKLPTSFEEKKHYYDKKETKPDSFRHDKPPFDTARPEKKGSGPRSRSPNGNKSPYRKKEEEVPGWCGPSIRPSGSFVPDKAEAGMKRSSLSASRDRGGYPPKDGRHRSHISPPRYEYEDRYKGKRGGSPVGFVEAGRVEFGGYPREEEFYQGGEGVQTWPSSAPPETDLDCRMIINQKRQFRPEDVEFGRKVEGPGVGQERYSPAGSDREGEGGGRRGESSYRDGVRSSKGKFSGRGGRSPESSRGSRPVAARLGPPPKFPARKFSPVGLGSRRGSSTLPPRRGRPLGMSERGRRGTFDRRRR